jgi:porphobilinogen deaminase
VATPGDESTAPVPGLRLAAFPAREDPRHAPARAAAIAERAFLAALDTGCTAPAGVLAELVTEAGAELAMRSDVGWLTLLQDGGAALLARHAGCNPRIPASR